MTQRNASFPAARKHLRALFGSLLLTIVIVGVTMGGARAEGIDVEIRGFNNDTGQASVQVFGSRSAYQADKPDFIAGVPITARVAHMQLSDLQGAYALVALHDLNGDGILRALPFGLVLDPHGYSQGAWNGLSRPGWELAAFSSTNIPSRQLIQLRIHPLIALAQMLTVGLPALVAVFTGLALVRISRAVFANSAARKETSHD